METLKIDLLTNQKLEIETSDSTYTVIKGLTKIERNYQTEKETFSTFEMEGYSDSNKTGFALSWTVEGYVVSNDPGNEALVAKIPLLGDAGNAKFRYTGANGKAMTFAACVEGNYGTGETKKLAPLSVTLTVKGKPEEVVASV